MKYKNTKEGWNFKIQLVTKNTNYDLTEYPFFAYASMSKTHKKEHSINNIPVFCNDIYTCSTILVYNHAII